MTKKPDFSKDPNLHPEAKPGEEDPQSPNYDPEAIRLSGALRAIQWLNAEREKEELLKSGGKLQ